MRLVVVALLTVVIVPLSPSPSIGAPGGALDPSFDGDGIAETDVESDVFFGEADLDPEGRILALVSPNATGYQVWRFTPTGSSAALDPTFDGNGVLDLGLDDVLDIRHIARRSSA